MNRVLSTWLLHTFSSFTDFLLSSPVNQQQAASAFPRGRQEKRIQINNLSPSWMFISNNMNFNNSLFLTLSQITHINCWGRNSHYTFISLISMQVGVYHILGLRHQQHFRHCQNKKRICHLSQRGQFVDKNSLIISDKEEWKEYFSEHLKNLNNSFRKPLPNNQTSLCACKNTEVG